MEIKVLTCIAFTLWFLGAVVLREWLVYESDGAINEDWAKQHWSVRYMFYTCWFVLATHLIIFNLSKGNRNG